MQKNIFHRWQVPELLYPALVLIILLLFTYGAFIRAPYIGFYFNPTDGHILQIFTPAPSSLQNGDVLLKVGNISWEEYYQNSRQGLFNDVKKGETVTIIVDRNGQNLTIRWKIPGFNQAEFYGRFINVWWLAYVFLLIGFAAQLLVHPKDTRWKLLVASNYLTGLWIIFGVLSARHLWESSILLHVVTWLLIPVYLHFHWIFPKPLATAPKSAVVILYAISALFALGELAQIFPKSLYALGLLVMLVSIIGLQVAHFRRHPEQRRAVGFVALAVLLAVLPTIVISIFDVAGSVPQIAALGLFALPFMPLAYLFIIYRNQLGGLEIRANRIISLYAFLILLSTALAIIISSIMSLQMSIEESILFTMVIAIFAAFISIQAFPVFQVFVEKRILGITLPYQNLQEIYSTEITLSTSLADLLQLLKDKVFPTLLVRQFAFIQIVNGNLKTLFTINVDTDQLPNNEDIGDLRSRAGKYRPDISSSWVRLILPLKLGEDLIGFWLLGRRDPNDIYPQVEITILQSIANQTAIALSNIIHSEQLKKVYQLNIERYEKERLQLALDLHDSILNQLAYLRTSLDDQSLPPEAQNAYTELTQRLREIVSDLRPPMLMYGLKPAIEALADNLMERSGDNIMLTVDIQAGDERYPLNMEQHLFRIVQEACENILRHAQAQHIEIFGSLSRQKVDLTIKDDGKGFIIGDSPDLTSLLANNHFGLAGMMERASLIGAELKIHSTAETGTMINITWNYIPENK